MGGTHEGQLPANLRLVSAGAAAIWFVAALLVMGRADLRNTPLPDAFLRPGAWVLVGVLAIGALMNFASSSPWERFMWGPFSLVLAGLCFLVARSDSIPS